MKTKAQSCQSRGWKGSIGTRGMGRESTRNDRDACRNSWNHFRVDLLLSVSSILLVSVAGEVI